MPQRVRICLPALPAISIVLDLETTFSTVFATLWSQTFICHDIRNILMLELFMLHGILRRFGIEGVFRVCLVVSSRWGFCRGCLKSIWGWFKILFGVVFFSEVA